MAELRHIVHIDLDSFFVSVERLKDASLNGKPVIIGGTSDRGVVASCSYEARKYGIHSAMPIKQARSICPHALIIKGNYSEYSKASRLVTDIIRREVPLFEKTSIDEFYIDLTGMDRFFGCYKLASELRQKVIRETGLPISFGLSANKIVSKVATGQAKPNGQLYVEHGNERAFLAPLPVRKIPMIGEKACETLSGLGIHRVGDLQRQDLSHLERVFGKAGLYMWEKANGIDNSPVEPYHERKSISTEHTFEHDIAGSVFLDELLVSMTEQLTYSLRTEKKYAACIAVKIRYSNFDTHSQQMAITPTNADHVLFPLIRKLFRNAYQKGRPIRLIGVRLTNLSDGNFQPGLFDDHEKNAKLYEALDNLNNRFGKKTITRAATLGFSNRNFNPFKKT
ncbi:MAG TPA: DNA polymerase IV [Sphingobacteriaceae bacterium]